VLSGQGVDRCPQARYSLQDAWMAAFDADDLTIPPELDRRGEIAG
jgi:hypothetical protein